MHAEGADGLEPCRYERRVRKVFWGEGRGGLGGMFFPKATAVGTDERGFGSKKFIELFNPSLEYDREFAPDWLRN